MGKLINFFRGEKPQAKPENPLLDLLKEEVDRKAASQVEQHYQRACRYLVACLFAALIGTMLPISAANAFFSVTAAILTFVMIVLSRRASIPKKTITALALLACASVGSGCSPIWASIDSDVLSVCRDSTEISCKYGLAKGWSVLGIPVTFATIGQARLNGGVDKVFGVETIKGVGLVSVTRLTVYGG